MLWLLVCSSGQAGGSIVSLSLTLFCRMAPSSAAFSRASLFGSRHSERSSAPWDGPRTAPGLSDCAVAAVSLLGCRRSVRDPANAGLVNADPELQQYVRSVKLSAEDVRSKMRSVAKPVFERQVGVCSRQDSGFWGLGSTCIPSSWGDAVRDVGGFRPLLGSLASPGAGRLLPGRVGMHVAMVPFWCFATDPGRGCSVCGIVSFLVSSKPRSLHTSSTTLHPTDQDCHLRWRACLETDSPVRTTPAVPRAVSCPTDGCPA
jgi:hypothetical protein